MKEWKLAEIPQSGPAIVEGEDIVMYCDDLSPELMSKIVEMRNQSKTLEEISFYLSPGNPDCTEEQHEFIMENITNFIKLTDVAENTDQRVIPKADFIPESEEKRLKREAKTAKMLETRSKNKNKTVGSLVKGSSGTAKAIEEFQEKIDLLKILDKAEVLEIPAGLTATGRNLLIEFQKEQEGLIQKYIDQVKLS